MKKVNLLLLLITLLGVSSCSGKLLPRKSKQAQPQTASTVNPVAEDCDSTAEAALKTIANNDTADQCQQLKIDNYIMATRLQSCAHEVEILNEQLALKPKVIETFIDNSRTKYKNSFNDVQKNSNNSTEIIKLKNSLLAKDSSILSLEAQNIGLNSRIRDLTKNKDSNTGSGSNTAKSGNTTDKAPFIAWLLVFLAGGVFFHIVPYLCKTYAFPWLGKLSFVKKLLT